MGVDLFQEKSVQPHDHATTRAMIISQIDGFTSLSS